MKYEEFFNSYFKSNKLKDSEENNSFSKKKRKLFEKLRPANLEDYTSWLKGFIRSGGRPTHYRDYPFIRMHDQFFVAKHDFWMVPLYGAKSVKIIVPKGIRYLGGELGHSELYFFEDFSCSDNSCVSVYSDIRFKEPFLNDLLSNLFFEYRGKRRLDKFCDFLLDKFYDSLGLGYRYFYYEDYEEENPFDQFLKRIKNKCGLKSLGELSDDLWFNTCLIFYSKKFDFFKGKVDEFENYFSRLNGKIKEAIICMILEEDLKDEKILSWLEENERSLIRKLTFN